MKFLLKIHFRKMESVREEGAGRPTFMAGILDKDYRMKEQSTLKNFLHEKMGLENRVYTFREILTMMKQVIASNKDYDENNPEVILCSEALEKALDQVALHVTQLPAIMLRHMQCMEENPQIKENEKGVTLEENTNLDERETDSPGNVTKATLIEKTGEGLRTKKTTLQDIFEEKFIIQDKLAKILKVKQDPEDGIPLEKVVEMIKQYVEDRKDTMIDSRNKEIIITRGDPLGELLGVQALHEYQIRRFITKHMERQRKRQQLIVIRSNTDVEMTLEFAE